MNDSVIYKFDLQIEDTCLVRMPQGARILDVQVQQGHPRIWAVVDPHAPIVVRTLFVRGTGHTMFEARNALYLGTFQMRDSLVFHVFDGGEDGRLVAGECRL